MSGSKKVLIIGNSEDIVKTFYYVFKNNQVTNVSFRKTWNNLRFLKKYDIIIFSGFHHNICKLNYKNFLNYTKRYIKFIYEVRKKTKYFYLISTDLSIEYSTSRIVFFYHLINKEIKLRKGIKIISFDTIIGHKNDLSSKIKISLFKVLRIKTLYYKKMVKKINNAGLIKNRSIKFYLIKRPRSRLADRIMRLFIDLFLLKLIFKKS